MDLKRLLDAWVAQGEATAANVRAERYAGAQEPLPYPGKLLKGLAYDPLVAAGELAGGKEVPYLQQDLTRNVSAGWVPGSEPFRESFSAGELDPRYVEKVADVAMNLDMPGIGKGAVGAAAGAAMPDMNQLNINPFPTKLGDPNFFTEVPGSHLGGSTGAKLVEAIPGGGAKYVAKAGASPEHVNEELIADDLYRAMGFPHPSTFSGDIGGVPHRISPFVKGRDYPNLDVVDRTVAEQRLRDQFMGDALLANWDVTGGSKWPSIILDPGTLHPLRIDPGGALRYRAQGAPKGAAFEKNAVPELQSMQKGATANMLPIDLQYQYGKYISPNEAEIMKAVGHDPQLEDIMGGRLDALRWDYGAGTAGSLPPTSQLTPPPTKITLPPTPAPPAPAPVQVLHHQGNPDYADWLTQHGIPDTPEHAEDWANSYHPGTTTIHGGYPPAPEFHGAFAEYNKLVDKLIADGDSPDMATWLANDAVNNPSNYPHTLAGAGVYVSKIHAGLNIGVGGQIKPGPTTAGGTGISSSLPAGKSAQLAAPAIHTAPFKPTSPPELIRPGGKFDWEGDFDKLVAYIAGGSGGAPAMNLKNPVDLALASDLAKTQLEHPGTYTGEATKAGINLRGLGHHYALDPSEFEWTVKNRQRVAAGNAPWSHPRQDVWSEPGWASHQYRNQSYPPLYPGGSDWPKAMDALYNANIDANADIIGAIKPSNSEAVKTASQLSMLDKLPRDWLTSLTHEPYVPHAVNQSVPDWKNWLPPDLKSAMTPEKYAQAMAGGFDPRLFGRGSAYPFRSFMDPSGKSGSPYIFHGDRPSVYGAYGSRYVYPEALRFGNTQTMNMGGRSYGGHPYGWMEDTAQAGRRQGFDTLEIQNMHDMGGVQTQYLTANPNQSRSPYAEFNPARFHEPNLMAARVGGINPFAAQQQDEEPLFPWLPNPPARARPRA